VIKLKILKPNTAFESGRAEERLVLGLLLRRRTAQRERWAADTRSTA